MTRYFVDMQARRWERFGVLAGLAMIALNWFALVTPYLSGPVFHPLGILLGALLVYACALALGGVSRDLTERDY